MGEPHVISALVAKRAQLDGISIDLDKRKAKIRAEINHIDHALAIFGYKDPPRDIKPKQAKTYRFKRRELGDLMRRFEGGTNRDIALRIIDYKHWNAGDMELVRKVTDSVKSAKNWQQRKLRL